MKAIYINAEKRTVEEIDLKNPDGSNELQDLVGGYICCGWTWYSTAGFPNNVLYVDDEGLMKGYDHYFRIHNAEQVGQCNPSGPSFLYGNGVIVGVNEEGESVDTTIIADDLQVLMWNHEGGGSDGNE